MKIKNVALLALPWELGETINSALGMRQKGFAMTVCIKNGVKDGKDFRRYFHQRSFQICYPFFPSLNKIDRCFGDINKNRYTEIR